MRTEILGERGGSEAPWRGILEARPRDLVQLVTIVTKLTPQQQRAKDARDKKMAEMQEQIDNGSLTVRKMTPEEREKFGQIPDRPRDKKNARRR